VDPVPYPIQQYIQGHPEPYNVKIDLLELSADNTFNLHYQVNRSNNTSKQNEITVLFRLAKYYFIGTSESCRSTSLMTEIEIARYVVGEHKELSKNVYKSLVRGVGGYGGNG